MKDTERVYDHFWETCFDSGQNCDLFQPEDTSSRDIRSRFDAFIDDLGSFPAPYITSESYSIVTRDDVLAAIFQALYQPQRDFPLLAKTLFESMSGNFTSLVEHLDLPNGDSCPLILPATYTWSQDAQIAIACGDADLQTNMSLVDFKCYLERLKTDSPSFGARWSTIRLGCTGWKFRPKYRFTGPWETPIPDTNLVDGKPAAPLLFISSRWDPVTPLSNAIKASQSHAGSAVLIQNNAGHGSLLSPGKCREDFIKKYFETGEVPHDQTTCEPDCFPFQNCSRAVEVPDLYDKTFFSPWSGRPALGF